MADYDYSTFESPSEILQQQRQENASVVSGAGLKDLFPTLGQNRSFNASAAFGQREIPGVPAGAMPQVPSAPQVNLTTLTGKNEGEDLRVRLKVPPKYISELTSGGKNELYNLQGIIFPYTPSISVEFKADYSMSNPIHSNFAIYFYQKSSIGAINVQGKFTVEHQADADVYMSTVHLLRALTKMRSGGRSSGDADSGAPPPVCRFFAYGDMMFEDIPVVVSMFRQELPEGVDYLTFPSLISGSNVSVPAVSTIAITLLPVYSRDEMQRFNVTDYLSASGFKQGGYI